MIIAVDAKNGMELADVVIPAGIDNLHYGSKRNRLYASCGDGAVAAVEKKGDKYELIAKVETATKAKTSAYHSGSGRLYVGVPRVASAAKPPKSLCTKPGRRSRRSRPRAESSKAIPYWNCFAAAEKRRRPVRLARAAFVDAGAALGRCERK